ncbi:MAG: hypothetical protein E5V49_00795 [Mesorhizobium sp.]|nr:hypothetical protein EN848_32550 [bacterium M00.F.Ca.ET.205.01.1.1]TGU45666.1 hypothetical protein EN795_33345 [bacterium M00.F.Ca.ET.152.01.1.1]TGV31466.1 hypothetical protein EN829_032675 [Mesorhizobium sp. M00.F.Ca.ET.186.01.1.1]TGZ38674.1 hypothetical protein EN805_32495 [bacterium M00.F.Ca.ET.162.01.1.1]TIW63119.1 MAG: hypothetical protein E5V48_01185 [Mesorhizobium sp.]
MSDLQMKPSHELTLGAFSKAPKQKKVLVAGGGPAGMKMTAVAAARGSRPLPFARPRVSSADRLFLPADFPPLGVLSRTLRASGPAYRYQGGMIFWLLLIVHGVLR